MAVDALEEFYLMSYWLEHVILSGMPWTVSGQTRQNVRLSSVRPGSDMVLAAAIEDGIDRSKRAIHLARQFEPFIIRSGLASETVRVDLAHPIDLLAVNVHDKERLGGYQSPRTFIGPTAHIVASQIAYILAQYVAATALAEGVEMPGLVCPNPPYGEPLRKDQFIRHHRLIHAPMTDEDRENLRARLKREAVIALSGLGYNFPKPSNSRELVTLTDIAGWVGISRTSLPKNLIERLGSPVVEHAGRSPALYDRESAVNVANEFYPGRVKITQKCV